MVRVEEFSEFWEQLKRHEGSKRDKVGRHVAYRCPAGALTIGWGHNLDANPIPDNWFSDGQKPKVGSVITNATAEDILKRDVADCAKRLDCHMYWWRQMCAPRQAVLLNMCFNLGYVKFRGFSKMLDATRRGNWAGSVFEMEASRWFHQVGRRAKELVLQMYTGKWVDSDGRVMEEEADES